MSKSELILLFNPDNEENMLDQLSKLLDDSTGGKHPSMIIVNRKTWTILEGLFQEKVKARYGIGKPKEYERAGIDIDPQKRGFPSLMFQDIPIVSVSGDNIIALKVGEYE